MGDGETLFRYDYIALVVMCILWYAILLPLFIVYHIRYSQSINDPFIYARQPQLALVANYFLMVLLFVVAPYSWCEIIFYENYQLSLVRQMGFFFRLSFEQVCIWLRITRYWYLYYNFHYTKYMALSVYINAIDDSKDNFYVKHKNTLGNLKYLLKMVAIFCTTMSLIGGGMIAWNYSYAMVFLILFFLGQIGFFLWLAFTISKLRDTLLIRKEILTEAVCFLLGVLSLLSTQAAENPSGDPLVISLVIIIPGTCTYPVVLAVTTIWVYYQMLERWKLRPSRFTRTTSTPSMTLDTDIEYHLGVADDYESTMRGSVTNYSRTNTNTNTNVKRKGSVNDHNNNNNNKSNKSKRPATVTEFLPDKDGFELFAEHLIKEYAIENLLFLIECEEFKKHCKIKFNQLTVRRSKIPRHLPNSAELKQFSHCLKLQFCVIFHKYIDPIDGEFCVNLSSYNRLCGTRLYNEFYDIAHGLKSESNVVRKPKPITRAKSTPNPIKTKRKKRSKMVLSTAAKTAMANRMRLASMSTAKKQSASVAATTTTPTTDSNHNHNKSNNGTAAAKKDTQLTAIPPKRSDMHQLTYSASDVSLLNPESPAPNMDGSASNNSDNSALTDDEIEIRLAADDREEAAGANANANADAVAADAEEKENGVTTAEATEAAETETETETETAPEQKMNVEEEKVSREHVQTLSTTQALRAALQMRGRKHESLEDGLSKSAQKARVEEIKQAMVAFVSDPNKPAFVLKTYADTMSSTQTMIEVLDDSLKDVYSNLRDSFSRFLNSGYYRQWCNANGYASDDLDM